MSIQAISHPSHDKLFTARLVKTMSAKRLWGIWVVAMLFSFVIQLLTIDVLNLLYHDEAQIIDYGRLTFTPNSTWSVTWLIGEEKPILLWSYLGPLISEVSFILSGYSSLGPKISALIGGLFASTMALGWLLARKVPTYAAFGLSLVLLVDPLFLMSQRIGRVDSWVFGMCLACCWLLRKTDIEANSSILKWQLVLAGGLTAVAALLWPSAVLLFPLIAYELLLSNNKSNEFIINWKRAITKSICFLCGGIIFFIFLLIPIWENVLVIFGDITNIVSYNVNSSTSLQERLFAIFNYHQWLKMVKAFVKTFSPILPFFAIIGILIRFNWKIFTITAITLCIIFSSQIYEQRLLYLFPYFILIISSLFVKLSQRPPSLQLLWFSKAALIILVSWSVIISLFIRTSFGISKPAKSQQERIQQVASHYIGRGNYRIFLAFTYEFYFAGRSLGWQLYTPYVQFNHTEDGQWVRGNEYEPKDRFVKLLSSMDYAIFPLGSMDEKLAESLGASGLRYCDTINVGIVQHPIGILGTSANNRAVSIFDWYLLGREGTGVYLLFKRDNE